MERIEYLVSRYFKFSNPSKKYVFKDFDSAKVEYDSYGTEFKHGNGFAEIEKVTFKDGVFFKHERILSKQIWV